MIWTFTSWYFNLVYEGHPLAVMVLGFAFAGLLVLLKRWLFHGEDRAKHIRKWG